jgi:N-acetylglutamate synthase-like GNAT family acetyltransferase
VTLPPPLAWRRGRYVVSTDPASLDLDVIHGFLTASYWAAGISRERVQRSIEGSMPFGIYEDGRQVGFARVISDLTTFAYLADVFVVPEARGQGLSVWLMECIVAHPDLQGLRRWFLATRDAHGLYAKFGFGPLVNPERMMEYRPAPAAEPSAPDATMRERGRGSR